MHEFRKKVKQPQKSASNPFFKSNYVTLEGVVKAIDEALEDTGLSFTQIVEDAGNGAVSVSTEVDHESGEYKIIGPLTLTPEKRTPQGFGSAITYAKRYQLAAAFGITSDVDDDGNAGSFNQPQGGYQNQGYQNQPRQPQPKPQPSVHRQYVATVTKMAKENNFEVDMLHQTTVELLGIENKTAFTDKDYRKMLEYLPETLKKLKE
ncbi:hypothetical protein LEQ_1708c [Ligilactobacillus equi DPC 6820]|uniref:Uncharacterized protein n=2 Tax=Ligilactobacillus equi TaxID=137357 RepID=V7HVE5_9LACO|nr:hypothetical protein LEQ_1708c [Ligilactobacillus equi DPC 6820]